MLIESLMVEEAIYCHAVHLLRYAGLVQKLTIQYVDKDEILFTPMKKIVVRCMHKLAHTQDTEHTMTTAFRKQQGTSKLKQNAQYTSSKSDYLLTIGSNPAGVKPCLKQNTTTITANSNVSE